MTGIFLTGKSKNNLVNLIVSVLDLIVDGISIILQLDVPKANCSVVRYIVSILVLQSS